jgi:hypothetical protein
MDMNEIIKITGICIGCNKAIKENNKSEISDLCYDCYFNKWLCKRCRECKFYTRYGECETCIYERADNVDEQLLKEFVKEGEIDILPASIIVYEYSPDDNMMFHFGLKSGEGITMLVNKKWESQVLIQINQKGFINWVDMDGHRHGINTGAIESYKTEKFENLGIKK